MPPASSMTASLHLSLARFLGQCGFPRMAVRACQDAIETDPRCFAAHLAMGEALAQLRQWGAAGEAFRRAAALQPANVESQGNLVLALYRAGRLREAAASLRRLIDLRPGGPGLHLALGAIQAGMADPAVPIPAFRWAARLPSPPTTRRLLLGEAMFGSRRWDEILGSFQTARSTVDPLPAVRDGRRAGLPA